MQYHKTLNEPVLYVNTCKTCLCVESVLIDSQVYVLNFTQTATMLQNSKAHGAVLYVSL